MRYCFEDSPLCGQRRLFLIPPEVDSRPSFVSEQVPVKIKILPTPAENEILVFYDPTASFIKKR